MYLIPQNISNVAAGKQAVIILFFFLLKQIGLHFAKPRYRYAYAFRLASLVQREGKTSPADLEQNAPDCGALKGIQPVPYYCNIR